MFAPCLDHVWSRRGPWLEPKMSTLGRPDPTLRPLFCSALQRYVASSTRTAVSVNYMVWSLVLQSTCTRNNRTSRACNNSSPLWHVNWYLRVRPCPTSCSRTNQEVSPGMVFELASRMLQCSWRGQEMEFLTSGIAIPDLTALVWEPKNNANLTEIDIFKKRYVQNLLFCF